MTQVPNGGTYECPECGGDAFTFERFCPVCEADLWTHAPHYPRGGES